MYGQFCMIHKETDTVLAMTAVTGDMQGEMNVYYEEVLYTIRISHLLISSI